MALWSGMIPKILEISFFSKGRLEPCLNFGGLAKAERGTMNLLTMAKKLGTEYTGAEFVELLRQVIDLDALKDLSDKEAQSLHDIAQYLSDYMLLHKEFYGQSKTLEGSPFVVCNAPYIETQLTRAPGKKPDFSYLENYGVTD